MKISEKLERFNVYMPTHEYKELLEFIKGTGRSLSKFSRIAVMDKMEELKKKDA